MASYTPDMKVEVREGAGNPLGKAGNCSQGTGKGRRRKGGACKSEISKKVEMVWGRELPKDPGIHQR